MPRVLAYAGIKAPLPLDGIAGRNNRQGDSDKGSSLIGGEFMADYTYTEGDYIEGTAELADIMPFSSGIGETLARAWFTVKKFDDTNYNRWGPFLILKKLGTVGCCVDYPYCLHWFGLDSIPAGPGSEVLTGGQKVRRAGGTIIAFPSFSYTGGTPAGPDMHPQLVPLHLKLAIAEYRLRTA